MKVKMLRTVKGSPDGIKVETYEAGQGYDLPEDLAGIFLSNKWAERIKAIEEIPEKKEKRKKG